MGNGVEKNRPEGLSGIGTGKGMTVVKFGGSILDGSDGVRRLCAEVEGLPRPLLVVVSAFADVTNRLERIAALALSDAKKAEDALDLLFGDHESIAESVLAPAEFGGWKSGIEEWRVRLGEIVQGLSIIGELSRRTLDLTVHFGERLSSSIVSAALGVRSIPATDLLITDDRHRYARALIDLSRERVEQRLKPLFRDAAKAGEAEFTVEGVLVTEGYIARGTNGEVTTMGRESSDFSATFLGELLGAAEVRIYTGVPGVMTADPKLVSEATTVGGMSYGMARELAVLGAKVLHPRTVRPAERAGLLLTITDLQGRKTVIGPKGDGDPFSIAALEGAGLVSVELRETDEDLAGFVRELSRAVPIIRSVQAGRSFRAVTAMCPADIESAIAQAKGRIVSWSVTPAALVSLVRERRVEGTDARNVLAAVDNRHLLSFWSDPNERSISALVSGESVHDVVNGLHRQFLDR